MPQCGISTFSHVIIRNYILYNLFNLHTKLPFCFKFCQDIVNNKSIINNLENTFFALTSISYISIIVPLNE